MRTPESRTLVFAVGVLVVGGNALVLDPASAPGVAQGMIGALALVAALHVAGRRAPGARWTSPFDTGIGGRNAPAEADETARIRARFAGRRLPLDDAGTALPPETLRLLQPLIADVAARRGPAVSPLTRAVYEADPTMQPSRWTTSRPAPATVAEIVHAVLDDLDRLDAPLSDPESRS